MADLEKDVLSSVLTVDGDVISRHVLAQYLRECGYAVVEAASVSEAVLALQEPFLSVDIILCDVSTLGSKAGFELANWVRSNLPNLEVRLAGGTTRAAQEAAELCEAGPNAERPYDPSIIVDYIKQLRQGRRRHR